MTVATATRLPAFSQASASSTTSSSIAQARTLVAGAPLVAGSVGTAASSTVRSFVRRSPWFNGADCHARRASLSGVRVAACRWVVGVLWHPSDIVRREWNAEGTRLRDRDPCNWSQSFGFRGAGSPRGSEYQALPGAAHRPRLLAH